MKKNHKEHFSMIICLSFSRHLSLTCYLIYDSYSNLPHRHSDVLQSKSQIGWHVAFSSRASLDFFNLGISLPFAHFATLKIFEALNPVVFWNVSQFGFIWSFLHDQILVKHFWQKYHLGVCSAQCIRWGDMRCPFAPLSVILTWSG